MIILKKTADDFMNYIKLYIDSFEGHARRNRLKDNLEKTLTIISLKRLFKQFNFYNTTCVMVILLSRGVKPHIKIELLQYLTTWDYEIEN